MPIANILDLSTAHIPPDEGDRLTLGDLEHAFGRHRAHEHEYGYLVFVPGGFSAEDLLDPNITTRIEEAYRNDYDTPEWLLPIMVQAVLDNCVLVLFDQDADGDPQFRDYYDENDPNVTVKTEVVVTTK